jgi:hypothetical protein
MLTYIYFLQLSCSHFGALGWFLSFFVISQTVGLLGRVISSSQGLYLNTGQHKHRINAYTHQTSMPYVGFQPTIPASKRAKTVNALDRSATVAGNLYVYWWLSSSERWRRVALIRTDVSEDRIASIFRVHKCEEVTERSCKLLYRQRLVGAGYRAKL